MSRPATFCRAASARTARGAALVVCLVAASACEGASAARGKGVDRPAAIKGRAGAASIRLEAPERRPPPVPAREPEVLDDGTLVLRVTGTQVPIYARPGDRYAIGHARVGSELLASPAEGRGCTGGRWLLVNGRGHLCSAAGVATAPRGQAAPPLDRALASRRPDSSRPAPFRYGKVTTPGAPRLARLPASKAEQTAVDAALAARGAGGETVEVPDGLVADWLEGTYLVAIARTVRAAGADYFETSTGRYVRAEHVTLKPEPLTLGEPLADGTPVAFIVEETPLLCGATRTRCGQAERFARARVVGQLTDKGRELVALEPSSVLAGKPNAGKPAGDNKSHKAVAVARDAVRLAHRIERPKAIPADARWLHIDLSEQVLVAYEGDEPRYATLISSGLAPDATRTRPGTWQILRKYMTKTMRGSDDDGPYEVQEVPWSMYYDGNFAVHGAYWHENFGNPRSHGCVNVPAGDARWLYYWTEASLPDGWHSAYHRLGSWVHVTGETPPSPPGK